MKTVLTFGGIALAMLFLNSCETTGNPREGGLFGYSEGKAQQRLRDRENTLDSIESDTARQRRISADLEAQKRRKQRELNNLE